MSKHLAAIRVFLVAVLTAVAWGCDSDDGTGLQAGLGFLVGDWEAEILLVRNQSDPLVSVDLIDAGASFRLNIQPSGAYTATLTAGATPFTEIGTLTVNGDQVTFFREFPNVDTAMGTLTQLSENRIRLLGETRFDFGAGTEDADLETELVRQ